MFVSCVIFYVSKGGLQGPKTISVVQGFSSTQVTGTLRDNLRFKRCQQRPNIFKVVQGAYFGHALGTLHRFFTFHNVLTRSRFFQTLHTTGGSRPPVISSVQRRYSTMPLKVIDRVSTLPFFPSVNKPEAAQQLIRTTKSCLSGILRLCD